MSQLRIFSYLPNPRIWKATIAARLTGAAVDIRGAKAAELGDWLWDFDARPLSGEEWAEAEAARVRGRTGFTGTLFKTAAFLDARHISPSWNSKSRRNQNRHPLTATRRTKGASCPDG